MADIGPQEAVRRARIEAGSEPATPARAELVRRLDRSDGSYYLVVLGEREASLGVVAVAAASGEVLQWARLPGSGPHLGVDAAAARARAGAAADTPARLVWRPCAASLSPLYPLWAVGADEATAYVDLGGRVWTRLPEPGPGGGPGPG